MEYGSAHVVADRATDILSDGAYEMVSRSAIRPSNFRMLIFGAPRLAD